MGNIYMVGRNILLAQHVGVEFQVIPWRETNSELCLDDRLV